MSIKSMDLAWIVVADFKKAIKFYTEVVGLKIRDVNEGFGWAELVGEDGHMALGIAQHNSGSEINAGANAVVTMTVTDLDKKKEELALKKVKFIGEILEIPGHVRMLMCEDIDANKFQVVQVYGKH